jgi:hypothetical protein
MTKQPLTRINYNIPMGLYERLVSTQRLWKQGGGNDTKGPPARATGWPRR